MSAVPLSIAFTAGGLAVVNPCGFPLLPAFLSFYLGADERQLPPAPTRIVQGLVVGGAVALGELALFAVVGLPVTLGVGAIADAVPWVGLATGAVLAVAGLATRFSAELQRFAEHHGAPLLAGAGAIVALALASGLRHRSRGRATTTPTMERP